MDFGSEPVMMSLPTRLRDGASSPFHSPPLGRFISVPLGRESVLDMPTRNSPRSRRKRAELITSPNHSSAAATRSHVAAGLVSWNDASINSTHSELQPLHLEALQYPSPCCSPTPKKVHQYSSQEVAQTLTLIDAEFLRQIAPEELQNGAWMKKDLKSKLAPNVLAMVHASNDLAMLVPSEILDETTTHTRAKVISSFIKIASKCYRLHNYNSLKAVLAGLQCTPIFRLKKTWKEVPARRKKQFDRLSSLMSEEYNWSAYQQQLQDKLASNQPCIPFLGVLLSNIAQQDSSNAIYDANGGGYPIRRRDSLRKVSGVQDYLVLEAITVRNRLERLRKYSWRHSTGVTPTCTDHISLARKRALAIKKRSTHTMPKQDSGSLIGSSYRSRTNAYSMSLGSSSSDSQTLNEEVCLLSPIGDSEKGEGDMVFTLEKDEGILHRNISSSSESDDSPLITRKALNKCYQVPVSTGLKGTSRGRFTVKTVSTSSLSTTDHEAYKISVSEIDVSMNKKDASSPLNHRKLLSQTDSSSDASSNSPAELPRRGTPRVSISHIEIDLKENNDSIFEREEEIQSEMNLGLLSPLNSTIVPSRSLEGLCNSLEIEGNGQVRSSFQFGIGLFKFDKKSVSMQSLLSQSSSSGASSSDCSSANPSTTSLLSPATKVNRVSSCSIDLVDNMNKTVPQSPVRQVGSPNDQANPDRVSGSLSISCSENEDSFTECSINDRRLAQPRCSIDMEGPLFLRPRRGGSTVLQIAQTASPKLANSTDLLNKYQFLSLGCCEGIKDIPELRELLMECPHNTEGQNYKLSYEREP